MKPLIDEWRHIIKGKFIILILLVPLVVAAVFGYIFKNSYVSEAPLAIIDLDHSTYSRQLIDKLNSSQYVHVLDIYDNFVEAELLLYNEKFSGVLYLPTGLEAAYLKGSPINMGLYLDMTLAASATSIRTGVNEVVGLENAAKSTPLTAIVLEQRTLFNPTNSTIMSAVVMFVNLIMLVLLGSNTINIVPRLREEGRLQDELKHPLGIIFRVVPYVLIASVSSYLVMGVLKQIGGLRFEAHWLQIMIPFLLYMLDTSLLAMLIGWTALSVDKANGRILWLMMPSFLLSGGQVSVALLPELLQWINKVIPLSLHFKFLRGLGYKGGDLRYFIPELGQYIVLTSGFLLVIFFLVLKEKHEVRKLKTQGPITNATSVQKAPGF
ncbi:ABC transporter permease [Desulfosporosinus nitroreducens]|uniref:ABC transporter permease n=1 Tax=Desulfosporosinus nitroreducens TaxID=2018668 RepID=A0ABT8QMJ8_9FIRM|nr:ABC transporter permease [Desulfosporosinus nitroreducens]MDO0822553.1 ABC transporter permease [Desulfosporosinus nitroreducens]